MKIGIVGSGPAGVGAARAALARGHTVEIIDYGNTAPAESLERAERIRHAIDIGQSPSQDDLNALKANDYFRFRSLLGLLPFTSLPPTAAKSVIGSNFAFQDIEKEIPIYGASPPRSLAKGGLSNVWGTACYKLQISDYENWPINQADLQPHYGTAADLLGLSRNGSLNDGTYPPLQSAYDTTKNINWNFGSPVNDLIKFWHENGEALARAGLRGGASNLATNSPETTGPNHCRRCGLCLFGCPFGAMFSSSSVINDWQDNPALTYRSGVKVVSFREEDIGVSVNMLCRDDTRICDRFDRLVLAANTLSSLQIVLESFRIHDVPASLQENDMFIVPMITSFRSLKGWESKFSLSESIMAIDAGVISECPVHLQFYAYNDYFLGAAGRILPSFIRRSNFLNQLVIAFIYLHGDESHRASAIPRIRQGQISGLSLERKERDGKSIARRVLQYLRKHQSLTGLTPIQSMLKTTPFGFSGHLAGTLPMRQTRRTTMPHTNPNGRIAGLSRVFVADASNFPSLPAQNPTFTTVANAIRIASRL